MKVVFLCFLCTNNSFNSRITVQEVINGYNEVFDRYNAVFNRAIAQQNQPDDEIETINRNNINIMFNDFLLNQQAQPPLQAQANNIDQLIGVVNLAQQFFINPINVNLNLMNNPAKHLVVFESLIMNKLVPLIRESYHNRHPFRQGMFHHNIAQIQQNLQNNNVNNKNPFIALLLQTLIDQVEHAQGLPGTLDHIFDQNINQIHNRFIRFIINGQPLINTLNFLRDILIVFSSSGR